MMISTFQTLRCGLVATLAAGTLSTLTPAAHAQITDTSIVITRATAVANGYTEISARCPSGMVAIAGGIDSASPWVVTTLAPTFGNQALFELANGLQSRAPDGWYASIDMAEGPSTIALAVVCTKVAGAAVTMVASGQAAYHTDTTASAQCPSGYRVLGGGIDVDRGPTLTTEGYRISDDQPLSDGSDQAFPPAVGWRGGVRGDNRVFVVEPPPGPVFKVGAVCAQNVGTVVATGFGNAPTPGSIVQNRIACPAGTSAISGGARLPAQYLVGLQPVPGDDSGLALYQRSAGTYPAGTAWTAEVVRDTSTTGAGDAFNAYAACAVVFQSATVTLTSSANPAVYGQSVTYTATLTGGAGTPTGTVTFSDGGAALCGNVPLVNGQASCVAGAQTVIGTHPISAAYAGDAKYVAATGTLNQVVNKAGTATAITAHAPNPATTLEAIMVSASLAVVAPGGGVPTGTITVSDGAATCTIALPATACALHPVSAGNKTLVASYGGDSHFAASVSSGVGQTVTGVATSPPLPTPTGTGSGTIDVGGGGCTLTTAEFIDVTPLAPPPNFSFPQGVANFAVGGCGSSSVTVTVTYPQPLPPGAVYYKYGPTPTNRTPHWYIIPATILGNKVVFTLNDGQLGDDDLTVDGVIRDAGGPAIPDGTVFEFHNSVLDHYFITANPDEAAAIDRGSAGPGWSRTGGTFIAGGNTAVCRFYGSQSPGPNSHFYTIDPDECQLLKNLQASTPATQKRWNFENFDFLSHRPANGQCAAGTVPVYRAYNNGFTRGIDSNHRITPDAAAIAQVVARGWVAEGVVMCAPDGKGGDAGG